MIFLPLAYKIVKWIESLVTIDLFSPLPLYRLPKFSTRLALVHWSSFHNRAQLAADYHSILYPPAHQSGSNVHQSLLNRPLSF